MDQKPAFCRYPDDDESERRYYSSYEHACLSNLAQCTSVDDNRVTALSFEEMRLSNEQVRLQLARAMQSIALVLDRRPSCYANKRGKKPNGLSYMKSSTYKVIPAKRSRLDPGSANRHGVWVRSKNKWEGQPVSCAIQTSIFNMPS